MNIARENRSIRDIVKESKSIRDIVRESRSKIYRWRE